jgi:hypothetical protein
MFSTSNSFYVQGKYLCVSCPKLANNLSTIHAAMKSNVKFNEVVFVKFNAVV